MIHATSLHSVSSPREAEYLAGWQRARAEIVNLQRRQQEEQQAAQQQAARQALEEFLPVADNFQSLANHMPPELADNTWAQGVLHIARQFSQAIADQGASIINPENEMFDPQLHEAIEQVAAKNQHSGAVVEVLQVGYKVGEHLLRPAKVKVAK